jgi:hypothetical protein
MRALLPVIALACACGGSTAPAPAASPTPNASANQAKPDAQHDAAAKSAALDALTADESTKGSCDADHAAALEKMLADVEAGMTAAAGADGTPRGFQLVTKRVLALGSTPQQIELSVSGRGTELHVLAYAVRSVSVDVLQGSAVATTMRSPFQRTPAASPLKLDLSKIGSVTDTDIESDSRQVQIVPGQPLRVRLSGHGCAALAAFFRS